MYLFSLLTYDQPIVAVIQVNINNRFANEDITLPSGLQVKQGWSCAIPIRSLGRDPSSGWGPDCLEYRPERWLEWDDGKHLRRIPAERLPAFWGGPRACIGKDMARYVWMDG
jgi:cytochrome P450